MADKLAAKKVRKGTLVISGMSCAACSARVEKVLNRTEGVISVGVNLATNKATVEYDADLVSLEELAEQYPFVKNILEYRSLSKLISTYLEALPLLIRKETGRIHTTFNQTVTATGRLSSSDPNLQNIPVRTEEGKKIRSLFVPGEGYDSFISSDYSQVELRVLAHMSEDEGLIRAFLNKEDIHRRTAAEVMGIPFEDVTPEQRSHAKAVNFGIIYGISDFGLAQDLGIGRQEAREYMERYFARYPKVKLYFDRLLAEAAGTGYVETLFHRRRYLPELKSSNYHTRSFGQRAAMNAPIQGTAADIMKLAMVKVYRLLQAAGQDKTMILQVHDELIFDMPKEKALELKEDIRRAMEGVGRLTVPLQVEMKIGEDWYSMEKC